jgi:t-SNARE complex subunit (syntaxin)
LHPDQIRQQGPGGQDLDVCRRRKNRRLGPQVLREANARSQTLKKFEKRIIENMFYLLQLISNNRNALIKF